MLKLKRIFWLIILGAFLFSSCLNFNRLKMGELRDTSWRLVSFGNKIPIPGSEMTAAFSSNEIQGNASCNHYFGDYKASRDQISITGLGWTEMACQDPEGIMEQEQTLMGLLSKAAEFNLQGNTLQIRTSTGEVLVFESFNPQK
jgi:heat shock protein HslJ